MKNGIQNEEHEENEHFFEKKKKHATLNTNENILNSKNMEQAKLKVKCLLWAGCCFTSFFGVVSLSPLLFSGSLPSHFLLGGLAWSLPSLVVLSSSPSLGWCCSLPLPCGWCCFLFPRLLRRAPFLLLLLGCCCSLFFLTKLIYVTKSTS